MKKFENMTKIPKPDFWGGWIIKPLYFEFWYNKLDILLIDIRQGRKSRLHDRICYEKDSLDKNEWYIHRLSP